MRECANADGHITTSSAHAIWVEAGRRRLVRRRDVNPRRRTSSLLWIGFASVTGVCLCIIGSICAFFFFSFFLIFSGSLFWAAMLVIFAKNPPSFFSEAQPWRARQSQRPDAAGPISVITTRSNTARRRVCRVWKLRRSSTRNAAPTRVHRMHLLAFLHRAVDVPTLCAPPPTQPQCVDFAEAQPGKASTHTAPHCTFGDHHTLERPSCRRH